MTKFIITIDLDWACEAAIEETLSFFIHNKIKPTVFITHRSDVVEMYKNEIDIGLHPFFGENSSHGSTITEVVSHVVSLPHNLKAFRSHRFGICNLSKQAMVDAGMLMSSNVCANLEAIKPFQDRCGLLEAPIFLEDGGYLWLNQPLTIHSKIMAACDNLLPKIILIHPMHFSINTPTFNYMLDIKKSLDRKSWATIDKNSLHKMRWNKRGIRDFIIDLLTSVPSNMTLRDLYNEESIQRNLPAL